MNMTVAVKGDLNTYIVSRCLTCLECLENSLAFINSALVRYFTKPAKPALFRKVVGKKSVDK